MSTEQKELAALARIRTKLARPKGARRIDELLSRTDAAQAIAMLPVPEVYQLIKEVGFGDSLELLELATPEQIRGCLDLDIWEKDQIIHEAIEPWLEAIMLAGYEKTGAVWEALDAELAAIIIARYCRIYDLSLGEEVPGSVENPLIFTVDTFFALEILDPGYEPFVNRLVDFLYRADMVNVRHSIMAARSEPPAELEEMSYRWRSGRLADLGYPDFYEALEVFRPINIKFLDIGEGSQDIIRAPHSGDEIRSIGGLSTQMAEDVVSLSFLARALDLIDDENEIKRLEQALMLLLNKVLSASQVSPGDPEEIAAYSLYTTSTLSVGLEILAKGNVDAAGSALKSVSLTKIFRLGYTHTLRLSRMARFLLPKAQTAAEPALTILAALQSMRPMFAKELESGIGYRPFGNVADIHRTSHYLMLLTMRIAIANALGADLGALAELPDPRTELDDHVRTALVRCMSGGPFESNPLSNQEITAFCSTVFNHKKLNEGARELAGLALTNCLQDAKIVDDSQAAPALLSIWLDEIEESLGGVSGDVDPRFVTKILLCSQKD